MKRRTRLGARLHFLAMSAWNKSAKDAAETCCQDFQAGITLWDAIG